MAVPNVLVASVKGGSGKTLVAINTAYRLSEFGTVGLLDGDIDSPHLPTMMGMDKRIVLDDEAKCFVPIEVAGIRKAIRVMSWGRTGDMRGKGVTLPGESHRTIIRDMIRRTKWGPLSWRVSDLPAGSSDELLEVIKVFDNVKGLIAVTQPNTLEPLQRVIDICRHYGIKIIGVIENMSGAVCECGGVVKCPCCNKDFDPFIHNPTIRSAVEPDGIKYLGKIPLSGSIANNWRLDTNKAGAIIEAVEAIRT